VTPDWGFGRTVARGAALTIGFLLVALVVMVAVAARNVLVLMLVAVIFAAGLQPLIAWLRPTCRSDAARRSFSSTASSSRS
jgi:predicted PurR-regulated permease PerM